MADALTTRYGLVKPEVGASQDTWGGKNNANRDDIDKLFGVIDTTGAANAYVLTTGLSLAAYVDGQTFIIRANHTNTGAATINVDSLGAKSLTKLGGLGLAAGEIVSGRTYIVARDTTGDRFQVLNVLPANLLSLAVLADPNVDAVAAWDDSAGAFAYFAFATAAEIWANTADKALRTTDVWTSADPVTIAFSATQTLDFGTFINGVITLTANTVLQTPTNRKKGQSGCIELIQDATGSRTMDSANAAFVWVQGQNGVLSTAPNARDLLFYQILDDDKVYLTLALAVA